jgi:hypothetical protein
LLKNSSISSAALWFSKKAKFSLFLLTIPVHFLAYWLPAWLRHAQLYEARVLVVEPSAVSHSGVDSSCLDKESRSISSSKSTTQSRNL